MSAGAVHGVLFDIDETLVDLYTAMGSTLRAISAERLSHFSEEQWQAYHGLFTSDPKGYYDAYLAGDLSFTEQRILRVQHAEQASGLDGLDEAAASAWNEEYDALLPLHFKPFADVFALLDLLELRGIPYGAVSNNVADYQRAKLDAAGLNRVEILVGIDTVGAAKPEPAIFLEGVRQLGTDPGRTLYVGDNPVVDAEGACAAGLQGVWLDRTGAAGRDGRNFGFPVVTSLSEVSSLLN